MEWEQAVMSSLKENEVRTVAYLPDTALSSVIDRVEADDDITAVEVTREEQAVAVVSGSWLGHRRGAILCQSSGLATAINALASLSKPARIPFVGLVTRRGDLGEFNLAQVPFGYAMPDILDDLGVRNHALADGNDVARAVDMATKTAFATEEPYILLLESSLLGAKDEF
jgi:sulfopyruvate decarboxylase alpha subunit